jgi:signal transduction histidine kinase
MRARYWVTVVLAGFAVYTAIAVLGSISTMAYWAQQNYPYDPTSFVANRFLEQYTCALFVAPLFWLVERYPVTRAPRGRNVAILCAWVVAFILVKYAIMLPLFGLWAHADRGPYWLTVLDNATPVAFDFFAIIGVAHALRYYHAVGERERAAADLKTQLVQARLDALRGQLHPHFIFNSLNAAATLMHEDVDGADRMLTQLGDLLRMSLDRAEPEIPLDDELALAERYLAIMRYRFSDRLTVDCHADDAARSAMVPTFLTQPLLENALEHGIGRRPGPGRVSLDARRTDGMLELSVTDDGPGVTSGAEPGIGLSNTRARLQQLYGNEYLLKLEPAPGGGARTVVRIPYRECLAS